MDDEGFYPPSVSSLIRQFAELPGIGKRTAERLAFHVLSESREKAMKLALAIRDAKTNLRACGRCFNIAEEELCAVCADPRRDPATLCVVELPRDVIAIEKAGFFHGVYHVLQGRLSPVEGAGPERLRVRELSARLTGDKAAGEVILATSSTVEGDATAAYLAELLKGSGARITRLARGLASGANLENAAPSSLLFAFQGRNPA